MFDWSHVTSIEPWCVTITLDWKAKSSNSSSPVSSTRGDGLGRGVAWVAFAEISISTLFEEQMGLVDRGPETSCRVP